MLFTLGIEEEYQVIDPQSRELVSHKQELVRLGEELLPNQIKAELHESQVEGGTSICRDIAEAEDQVKLLRKTIVETADGLGLAIGAAGTHPFSSWQSQTITQHPRYDEIILELQDAARSNLIFGMHVHVGIPNRSLALQMANGMRYFLPHLYALSANSPFWEGRNTGFKSFRSKVFDKFPRTGIPEHFNSLPEYDRFLELLVKTKCIDNAKKIWWDIRVHPSYPTIEVRVCDVTLRATETIAIAAMIQALVAKLYQIHKSNCSFNNYSRTLINENKWRAGRYGLEGNLIDFGVEQEKPCKELILEMLDFVDDVSSDLGSTKQLAYIEKIISDGTGADRQLEVYSKNQNLNEVVDFMISETKDFN